MRISAERALQKEQIKGESAQKDKSLLDSRPYRQCRNQWHAVQHLKLWTSSTYHISQHLQILRTAGHQAPAQWTWTQTHKSL